MTDTTVLIHADACKAERVEITPHPDYGITVTRCLDCPAQQAQDDQSGKFLAPPVVTGAMVGRGRGDMDVDMRRAAPGDIPGVTR